jgi:hypothetical protein
MDPFFIESLCFWPVCTTKGVKPDAFDLPAHSLPDNKNERTCHIRFALSLKKAPPETGSKSPADPTETPTSRLEALS